MGKWKKFFFNGNDDEETTPQEETLTREAAVVAQPYGTILGLSKPFTFVLSRKTVSDDAEWNALIAEAKKNLISDLLRTGESPELINDASKKVAFAAAKASGYIVVTMRLIRNEDGKVEVEFFKSYQLPKGKETATTVDVSVIL